MKEFLLFSIVSLALACGAVSKDLTDDESKAVKAEIDSMMADFEKGNAKALLDKTHDSIFEMFGGREAFEKGMLEGVKQIMAAGIKFQDGG